MDFKTLSTTMQSLHNHFQGQALKSINQQLTLRNWCFGYYIQEYELGGSDRAQYGEKVIKELSDRLEALKIPSVSFSSLKLYKQFYQYYPEFKRIAFKELNENLASPSVSIGQALPGQFETIQTNIKASNKNAFLPRLSLNELINSLSFTHFAELVKIEDPLKRSFYEISSARGHWSARELKRQIGSLYFERSGLSKNKKKLSELIKNNLVPETPEDVIRDPFVFEFLGYKPKDVIDESTVESGILNKLQDFLLEMGKGFCFEARQKRIVIGGEYFFIDLVCYHRILKCHILIELKLKTFSHEHVGQLNTYINYYKKHEMASSDNPPIGILLCTDKNHALVEYALGENNPQLFVSKYQLELPSKQDIQLFLEKELGRIE